MRNTLRHFAGLLVSCLTIASCMGKDGGGPTDPPVEPVQVPTTLSANSSRSLSGTAGIAVSIVPAVTLRDAKNAVIAGTMVRFVVSGGGTIANDSSRTDANGVASVGAWTLGQTAGMQTVTASTPGLAPVTFSAQANAGAASKIVSLVPNTQPGVVNSAVSLPPSVRVTDQFDNPVAGVSVTFVVTAGGGTINGAQKTTGANGVATADGWILGTTAGTQRARADVAGVTNTITYTTTANAGAPARLSVVAGNTGSGVAGTALEAFGPLPSVSVTDAFGNPVSGVSVSFAPGANSGTVAGSPALTNGSGVATITSWILGNAATQTLVVTSAQVPGVQLVFTATAQVSSYDIVVRYVDVVPSARQQLAVTRAVTKWRNVILGNIGTSRVRLDAQNCGRNWTPAIDENIANLLILARIGPIDGVGGVVGDAGPCVLHSSSQLTSLGTMMFDSADLATLESSGLIDAVVAHEMGHVIGVGLLWTERDMVTGLGGTDPIFTGASAAQQFQLLLSGYSGRLTPVENAGGAGSINSHWRESVFRNELMTSVINGGSNPLSRVTVGSLRDIGYEVSYAGAETYSLTASIAAYLSPFADSDDGLRAAAVHMNNDLHVTSLFTADKVGRMLRWNGRQ